MPAAFRPALCVLLCVALAWAGEDDPEPPSSAKAEAARIAGTYDVVHFERDTRPMAANELKTMLVVLTKEGGGSFRYGNDTFGSNLKIDPAKKPREVDSTYTNGSWKGQTIKGIYKVEKDGGVTFCYAEPGMARPTKFETAVNSRLTLYTLKRVKQK
jgi:uncharacterized protein (TIGR03067 family)